MGNNEIHIKGAVDPNILKSSLTRKKQSKAERLAKIISGREEFMLKSRNASGSTNIEKNRKKLFLMTKFSKQARKNRFMRGTTTNSGGGNKRKKIIGGHDARKRRRKL